MQKIKLTQNKFALVDNEDFERLSKVKWCALKSRGKTYAGRNLKKKKGFIFMHVEIMKTPKGMDTDHIDGDSLNNQKKNLRICTRSQNLMNRGKTKLNKSGFKGVSWSKGRDKWIAYIHINKKTKNLGRFSSKLKAYEAYCKACQKYHGEFSRIK